MADYLLDSDILIWCLRGQERTTAFVRTIAGECQPACSALSVLEVELGIKAGEEEATRRLIDSLRVISTSKEIAQQAALFIRTYNARGRRIDFVDAVIASTCLQEGLILVTCNLKHYPMKELLIQTP